MYLGVSAAHSSNVPLVLTIKTGSITPQYHVVFDDCFSTVTSEAGEPEVWENLFSYSNQSWDQFEEIEASEPSRFEREELEGRTQAARMQRRELKEGSTAPNRLSALKEGSMAPNGLTELKEGSTAPLRMNDFPVGNDVGNDFGVSDGDGGARDGGARDGVSDGDGGVAGDGASDGEADAPRRSSRQRSVPDRLTYQQLGGVACHLAYAFVSKPSTILAAFYQRFQALNYDASSDTIEDEPPFALMVQASEKDDLTWSEARISREYHKFRDAALKEVQSLESKGSWEVVKRSSVQGKNVLPSTWALKRKRFPDGRIRRYKARFCV